MLKASPKGGVIEVGVSKNELHQSATKASLPGISEEDMAVYRATARRRLEQEEKELASPPFERSTKMDQLKDIRWKQRFKNFERSYNLLNKYINQPIETELERAGIIQFFEISFELSWKLMKDYLESEGLSAKSPRETIKQAFQIGLIDDGHIWIDALSDRNLTVHTYDEEIAKKMVDDIAKVYFPELKKLYHKLVKEL